MSSGADFAEWLPLRDPQQILEPGDVVGVFDLERFDCQTLAGTRASAVSRHEPPEAADAPGRIGFVLFAAPSGEPSMVVRLAVTVEPTGAGASRIAWTRVYTALDDSGRKALAALGQEAHDAKHRELNRLLVHYLRHGEAWSPEAEVA